MPYPKAGESKKSYVARFMDSAEAKSDFPDEKQRVAVAYSMFEKKNSGPFGTAEHPWPKAYKCNFIEPGLVFYQDLGLCSVCGDKKSCSEGRNAPGSACKTEGEMVLVGQKALAKMAKSFIGRPVIDVVHEDVEPNTIADGDADGIVTRVWLDGETGWWNAEFLIWNPETQKHCDSPLTWSVSCAYNPTDVNSDGGDYHNIPYHQEIKDGEYTHLAIVTSPRYEGARITTLMNSKSYVRVQPKGGKEMSWKFWERGERKNASPVNLDEKVNVGGEEVSMKELLDAMPEEKKEEAPKFNDDTMISGPKGEKSLGELKKNWADMKEKKNAEMKCSSCGQMKPKENLGKPGEKTVPGAEGAEAGHAEHREGGAKGKENAGSGEPEKLPDIRDKENAEDEAAKKEMEKKNADDAAAKMAEEKKNADDAAAKAKADEDEKAKALENAKAAKLEAGRKSFEALKNARNDAAGVNTSIMPVSVDERLAKGRAKYGSA